MLAIIGGSGMEELIKGLPIRRGGLSCFGESSPYVEAKIGGYPVILMLRHGESHEILPSKVNFVKNAMVLKGEGVTSVLSTTAVGSLKEEFNPGTLVNLYQYVDFTKGRKTSVYDYMERNSESVVSAHVPMGLPFCPELRQMINEVGHELALPFMEKGTVITIEGPRFSTRAESVLFRNWGMDLINMTTATENAALAGFGLHHAAVAMVTDYDSWKEDNIVTWGQVKEVMEQNSRLVMRLIEAVVEKYYGENNG